ncbi:hypothetical protein CWI38_0014p0090 [Hamiltosporidium tvaerminnensis]|uniref:Uncharacterized protein n=1 Tax=Hamiltosporidium tvaerminnensis TaxID=1176355 RepID=A0A4Q9M295_9MICR|nr:hypothetical protein CWI38_0014p0090 [Hamiltosporidium tvaerminnensis]
MINIRNIFYHLHHWYVKFTYISLFIYLNTAQIQLNNLNSENFEYGNDSSENFKIEITENSDEEISEDQINIFFELIFNQRECILFRYTNLSSGFNTVFYGSEPDIIFIPKETEEEQSTLDSRIRNQNNYSWDCIRTVKEFIQIISTNLSDINRLWEVLDIYDSSLNEHLQAILMGMTCFDLQTIDKILAKFINIHYMSSNLYNYLKELQFLLESTSSNVLNALNSFTYPESEIKNSFHCLCEKISEVQKNCDLVDRKKILFISTFHYANRDEMIYDSEIQFWKYKFIQERDRYNAYINNTTTTNTLSNPEENIFIYKNSSVDFENSLNSILNELKICSAAYLQLLNIIKTIHDNKNYPENLSTEVSNSYENQIKRLNHILESTINDLQYYLISFVFSRFEQINLFHVSFFFK